MSKITPPKFKVTLYLEQVWYPAIRNMPANEKKVEDDILTKLSFDHDDFEYEISEYEIEKIG